MCACRELRHEPRLAGSRFARDEDDAWFTVRHALKCSRPRRQARKRDPRTPGDRRRRAASEEETTAGTMVVPRRRPQCDRRTEPFQRGFTRGTGAHGPREPATARTTSVHSTSPPAAAAQTRAASATGSPKRSPSSCSTSPSASPIRTESGSSTLRLRHTNRALDRRRRGERIRRTGEREHRTVACALDQLAAVPLHGCPHQGVVFSTKQLCRVRRRTNPLCRGVDEVGEGDGPRPAAQRHGRKAYVHVLARARARSADGAARPRELRHGGAEPAGALPERADGASRIAPRTTSSIVVRATWFRAITRRHG